MLHRYININGYFIYGAEPTLKSRVIAREFCLDCFWNFHLKTEDLSIMIPGSAAPGHNVIDSEDHLEKLMKHTGCLELHYKVQECIAETKDWRKCQDAVMNFRKCMEAYKAKQAKE